MGFVVSSFALPIVLARAEAVSKFNIFSKHFTTSIADILALCVNLFQFIFSCKQIKMGACYLTLAGNVVVFSTIFTFFLIADGESNYGGVFP